MRTKSWLGLTVLLALLGFAALCWVGAGDVCAQAPGAAEGTALRAPSPVRWDLTIGIAVVVGLPCLGASYAVAKVGSAALGAASEHPELLVRGLLYVALAEGIAIYGLLMGVLLYSRLR